MGTHLNCINNAIQMGNHNICLFKEDKKYTCCNLKTTGVCVVIWWNMVIEVFSLTFDLSKKTFVGQLKRSMMYMYVFVEK